MAVDYAIVGLGNPGGKYDSTRHNLGFWALDRLSDGLSWKKQGDSLTVKKQFGSQEVLLIKPQSYMNLSGQALQPILKFYKIPSKYLIVVHDEVDLKVGRIQVRFGGSAAGHNGLSDIISRIGSKEFLRIRLGVGHPRDLATDKGTQDISSWVLGRPGPKEQELLEDAAFKAAEAAELLVTDGLEAAQQRFNSKT